MRFKGIKQRFGDYRIFGITAVEIPAHTAHKGRDFLSGFKLPGRIILYFADAFYTQHPGEFDVRRDAFAGHQFRAVQAEGFYSDQYLTDSGVWNLPFL